MPNIGIQSIWLLPLIAALSCATAGEGQRMREPLACKAPANAPAPVSQTSSAAEWQQTELYFGLSIKGGGKVSDEEWRRFVAGEICARFPAGFTIIDAAGTWRSPEGELVGEPSRVLLLLHPKDSADDAAIDAIRTAYKTAFHQDAVLRADNAVAISF